MKRRNINHHQMESKEEYNAYQREYQHEYYRENSQAWQDYLLRRRYMSYSLDKLKSMLYKKKNLLYSLNPKKNERLINVLEEIIAKKESMIVNYEPPYEPLEGTSTIQEWFETMNRSLHDAGL
jgi:hypothetical protein